MGFCLLVSRARNWIDASLHYALMVVQSRCTRGLVHEQPDPGKLKWEGLSEGYTPSEPEKRGGFYPPASAAGQSPSGPSAGSDNFRYIVARLMPKSSAARSLLPPTWASVRWR